MSLRWKRSLTVDWAGVEQDDVRRKKGIVNDGGRVTYRVSRSYRYRKTRETGDGRILES